MIAGNLLSHNIIPLRTSDTGAEALGIMNDFYVRHLPIVNDKQLLGLIAEDEILEYDIEEAIGSYSLSMAKPYVRETDHLYDVLKILSEYQLTVVPVVDAEVLDGAAIVDMLLPRGVTNFKEYAESVFMPYIHRCLNHVHRVDIVWDRYITDSLKQSTRESRGLKRSVAAIFATKKARNQSTSPKPKSLLPPPNSF